MLNYIIRRLLMVPLLLFGVTVLIFAMLQALSPVERSALYVRDIPKNDQALQGIIKRYGLDQRIYVQYWRWLVGFKDPQSGEIRGGILRGDFGYSRTASQPVGDLLARRFPATLEMALLAVLPVVAGGIFLGVIGAVYHNKPLDHIVRIFGIIGWSLPDFVFGLLLLMAFYAATGWFPPGRVSDWADQVINSPAFHSYTKLIVLDSLLNLRFDIFIDALRHLIMPVATLMVVEVALLLKITRSAMLEEMRQDYVTTARAKGLPEKLVTNRHIRRNALIPVITVAGLTLAGLMGGVVITETVFDYPGIGSWAAQAAASLDVLSMLGYALFSAVLLVAANLIVDVLYAVLDPRVRLS